MYLISGRNPVQNNTPIKTSIYTETDNWTSNSPLPHPHPVVPWDRSPSPVPADASCPELWFPPGWGFLGLWQESAAWLPLAAVWQWAVLLKLPGFGIHLAVCQELDSWPALELICYLKFHQETVAWYI